MMLPLRSYDGGSRSQLTHNDRDKGGHQAHDLEASRNFSFSHFTQGTTFILLWQSGLGKKHLWTKVTGDGTAYGKQDAGGMSKVPLMVNKESAVLSIFM